MLAVAVVAVATITGSDIDSEAATINVDIITRFAGTLWCRSAPSGPSCRW